MATLKETDDTGFLTQLERLTRLKEQGTLNEDEFKELKEKILAGETGVSEAAEGSEVALTVEETVGTAPAPDTAPTSFQAQTEGPVGLRALCWFLGVFFIIFGLSQAESEDLIVSFIMFAIAGLLLPPVRDWAYGITGRIIPVWVRALTIFCLVAYALHMAPVPTPTTTAEYRQQVEEEGASQPVIAETSTGLVFTIEELIERYNLASDTLKVDTKFSVKEEMDNGEYLTVRLKAPVYENMAMILTADNKTRVVQSLAFIGTGDGTVGSGVSILFGITATVMAIENPLMSVDQRSLLIREFDISELPERRKIELTRGNVKYTLSQSESIGTMLEAAPG